MQCIGAGLVNHSLTYLAVCTSLRLNREREQKELKKAKKLAFNSFLSFHLFFLPTFLKFIYINIYIYIYIF